VSEPKPQRFSRTKRRGCRRKAAKRVVPEDRILKAEVPARS
jgi:hypothetical protein